MINPINAAIQKNDVFTDLALGEENKMPKKSIVFKDVVVWVEKEGDKDTYIYVYTCICTDHLWNYTQETANRLLPGKLNERQDNRRLSFISCCTSGISNYMNVLPKKKYKLTKL